MLEPGQQPCLPPRRCLWLGLAGDELGCKLQSGAPLHYTAQVGEGTLGEDARGGQGSAVAEPQAQLYRSPDTAPTLSPTPADLLLNVIEVAEPPSSLLLVFSNPFHLHSCLS